MLFLNVKVEKKRKMKFSGKKESPIERTLMEDLRTFVKGILRRQKDNFEKVLKPVFQFNVFFKENTSLFD